MAGIVNYWTGQHRTVDFKHLPSQAVVHFFNILPQLFKGSSKLNSFKNCLESLLASQEFKNIYSFLLF